MSNSDGTSRQVSCPECNSDRTPPEARKRSHAQFSQCGSNRWKEVMESPEGERPSSQPRTLYVSKTHFEELTEKQDNRYTTEAQREEARRIFSDPELFEARVDEIMVDLARKAPAILADSDGDDGMVEAREDVEEQE
ncbi:hypothetical protein E6O75_ATG07819 [Venturia nashicola]|uniref:Uncharacterized protein n=1 Tax=Venturia nashicola TaxID=86259 RepID=A0A4Z1NID1_9PEZI|nr:hypothetical protein E6O75_ATG07819 [Venturia nashicola]